MQSLILDYRADFVCVYGGGRNGKKEEERMGDRENEKQRFISTGDTILAIRKKLWIIKNKIVFTFTYRYILILLTLRKEIKDRYCLKYENL